MEAFECEQVQRAIGGDREAYGLLIDAYQGMVFGVAINITGNYHDSEDIVQEAFLRAWQKLRTLSDPARFAAWLYTLAKHLALDHFRRRHRVPITAAEQDLIEQVASDAETPAEACSRKQLSALLWREVAQLPLKTREAILLYYMEGFSIRRAAAFLDITEEAVKARLSFGRERLREGMLHQLEGELHARRPDRRLRGMILTALPASGANLAGANLAGANLTGSAALPMDAGE